MSERKTYKVKTKFKTEIHVSDVYAVRVEDGFLVFKNGASDTLYAVELSHVLSYELENNN